MSIQKDATGWSVYQNGLLIQTGFASRELARAFNRTGVTAPIIAAPPVEPIQEFNAPFKCECFGTGDWAIVDANDVIVQRNIKTRELARTIKREMDNRHTFQQEMSEINAAIDKAFTPDTIEESEDEIVEELENKSPKFHIFNEDVPSRVISRTSGRLVLQHGVYRVSEGVYSCVKNYVVLGTFPTFKAAKHAKDYLHKNGLFTLVDYKP